MQQSSSLFKVCISTFQVSMLVAFYICAASSSNAEDIEKALKLKMKYLSQSQAVISKNLANANTPGYKAMELNKPKYNFGKSKGVSLETTSPMHIGGLNGVGQFRAVKQKDTYETAPNGNNVSIEEQMVKMSENSMEHQATLGIMKKLGSFDDIALGNK